LSLEQYILQTHNSKNSEDSMGVRSKPPNPPLWVRHALPILSGKGGNGREGEETGRENYIRDPYLIS